MGRGFNKFMANPYWRKLYEEAPSDELREFLRHRFEYTVSGRHSKSNGPLRLTSRDWRYLYDHAEGGAYRAFLKKAIANAERKEAEQREKGEIKWLSNHQSVRFSLPQG